MPTEAEVRAWVAQRARKDDRLYKRYGRPLERDHAGEFAAISDDGRILLGTDELDLDTRAIEQFGPGTFTIRRIGADAEIRWRRPR